jgi:hypothetical protein
MDVEADLYVNIDSVVGTDICIFTSTHKHTHTHLVLREDRL